MGDNTPKIGERVVYYRTAADPIAATVRNVIFWDVVDLELDGGGTLSYVRRVMSQAVDGVLDEVVDGRWERLR